MYDNNRPMMRVYFSLEIHSKVIHMDIQFKTVLYLNEFIENRKLVSRGEYVPKTERDIQASKTRA